MSIEFEQKYLVVKREDIEKYLLPGVIEQLNRALGLINLGRKSDGKPENTYLVINTDESYAGQVAQIMKEHGHCTQGGPISVETIILPFEFSQTDRDNIMHIWDQCISYLKSERCVDDVGISNLQRVLRLGYRPAVILAETLELNGYVGPLDNDTRRRKVLCK